MRVIAAVGALALCLFGCATPGERYEAQRLEDARTLAAKGDYTGAYKAIRSDLSGGGSTAQKAAKIVSDSPQFKLQMPDLIRAEMRQEAEPYRFAMTVGLLDYDVMRSILSPDDVTLLRRDADLIAAEGNSSNQLKWTLTDSFRQFSSLKSPDQQHIIYARSLAALRKNPPVGAPLRTSGLVESVFSFAKAAGPQSEEFRTLKAELPNLDIPTQDLKVVVASAFPEYAAKEIGRREVTINISFDDRLIEEDAIPKIRQLSPNLTIVKNNAAMVNVNVKKLQWDERVSPQQTQTITYSQGDVDILKAVLLMPKNAAYIYEVSSGGVQLSYAFEVKATSKGSAPFDEVVRDRASREWRSCANARIQNVFGGVQRADFIANNHMQTVCGSGGSPVSPDALRDEAMSRIVNAIGRIPAIASAVSGQSSTTSSSRASGSITASSSSAPFAAGDRVRHSGFGNGTIRSISGAEAFVQFDGRQKPTPVDMSALSKY